MNLSAKLSDWQKNNLISAQQKTAILDYENRVKRPLLFYSLLFLSSFCIGIGLIAIIAANWEIIPKYVKLLADFAALSAIAWGIWQTRRNNKSLLSEGLIICFALLILGSIGLIAQIYQLPSHDLSALLFWSLLTFPLLILSNKPLLPALWLLAFFCSLYDKLYNLGWFERLMDFLFRRDSNLGVWLALFVMLAAYRLLKLVSKPAIQTAWRSWLIFAFAFCAVTMDIFNYDFYYNYHNELKGYGWSVWGIALLSFAGFWWLNRRNGLWPALYSLAVMGIYVLATDFCPPSEKAASALMVIALLSIVAVYAYRNHSPRLLNFATVLIALRFFGIYLEIFGSLLTTGVGLIASGLVFLGIAIGWQKMRRRLLSKIGEK